jgi:hypothetical protein
MKTLALIARRKDIPRDAFRDHYEDVHAPLAIDTLLAGTRRYVRFHLREVLLGEPGFDVVTGFWYRDAAAALEIGKRLAGSQGEPILRDELTFMDKPANTFFAASEHPVSGSEEADAAWRAVVLVAAPEGRDVGEFLAAYESEQLPKLQAATRHPTWCIQNRAIAMGPDRPAFDAITHLHAEADAGVAHWAAEFAQTGATVVVARVTEHESTLPW